jgi:uncharacterized phage infection (PIP) family protein YhgE
MAFKFFNIGKANEEVSRLEGEVTRITSDLATANANAEAISTEAEKLKSDLTAANAKIAELNQTASDLATAKLSIQSLTHERDELAAKIADPKGEIAAQAAKAALSIAAGQGVTAPVAIAPEKPKAETNLEAAKKLTGLAKVIALEKLETEARKQNKN